MTNGALARTKSRRMKPLMYGCARLAAVTILDPSVEYGERGSTQTAEQVDCHYRWSSRRPVRRSNAHSHARDRGRISSTELASIVGAQRPNVTAVLRELEEDGLLHPAFPSGRGRGFHYLSSTPDSPNEGSDQ